jgi:hypothetical protein
MKKISLNSIKPFRKKEREQQAPARITNDTVAEHREQILAGGRKFKYPVQYVRHKLVINALIISIVSIILLLALGFQQLYFAQNSSDFMYRVAQLLPVPVATIANEPVRYSDYLLQYRASEHWLRKYDEIKLESEDGKRQLEGIKRYALNNAENEAYAAKLAREKGITVTDTELDAAIAQKRNTANGQISQEAYDASTLMLYGWSPADYRQAMRQSLLKAKVAFAIDDAAKAQADKAAKLVATGGDLAAVAKELGGTFAVQSPGLIDSTSSFNGLNITDVAKLEQGKVAGPLKSNTDDGYYFVRVVSKTDTQVNFEFVHIPLTAFSTKLSELKKSEQIHEFIKVAE